MTHKYDSLEGVAIIGVGRENLLFTPATQAQKEIWLDAQIGQDANCAYNESMSLRLRGSLDIDALRYAFGNLIQRHEALRTTLSQDGANLRIASSLKIDVPMVDLSSLGDGDREAKLAQLGRLEVEQPFDLIQGPLFRVQIVRCSVEEHLVILTAHQIVCDRWSWGVVLPELGALYSALKLGVVADLPKPERFSEYALLQEQHQGHTAAEEYWVGQYSDQIPVLDFPTDRPRLPLKKLNYARFDYLVNPSLVANLKSLGAQASCSFMTTLQAGFEVFLGRISGQEDIVVGRTVAGQSFLGKNCLVGYCANLLPLRSHINGEQSFRDYLQMRRQAVLSACFDSLLTFSSLLKKLALPQDASQIPLVPITFNVDRAIQGENLQFDDLDVEVFSNPKYFGNFEIAVNASEAGSNLVLECQYNTDLFDAQTIRHRIEEFEVLLSGIVANPNQSISKLPILPPAEHQLLLEWNETQADYPKDSCIHQLFENWVERTPDALAVVFENQQLTYRELNAKANQLAHYLQDQGVGPDVLVGICMERSLLVIVGILGILKAGGAYVPLDPAYPKDRLAHMLSDSQVPILLTTKKLVAGLPEHTAHVIRLDTDWGMISVMSEENLLSSATANNLAYVIYTSGSTGKPKGVTIEHRSVLNLAQGLYQTIYIHHQDSQLRVSVNGSLSFDTSVKQIIQILYGHTLEIIPEAIRFDGSALLSYLQNHKIDVFDCTPSQLRLLIAAGLLTKSESAPSSVLVGGEPIDESTWQGLVQAKHTHFYNVYGPTECTVDATVCSVRSAGSIPVIGRPITNTQIYILDRNLQLVPIGVPGEIYIGGDGLARGYLNRPELTREKFIPNPFYNSKFKICPSGTLREQNSKLYKTGDLARYLPDGNIECIGRTDNQVKIRGFRIELGEIEASVAQHQSVREVVIVAREDQPGDKRLVAYIVPHQEQAPKISELRSFLKQKLPDYMVPSAFVILEALPLTPNGKVNRHALPAPQQIRLEPEETFVSPRNELEIRLTKIWEKLLGIQPIGIEDNFFELGGHSLLAVRLLNEIEKVFGKNLPLTTFFEAQTVEQLARILLQQEESQSWRSLVMIQPGTTKPPLFCIHAIWGNVLFYQKLVRYLEPDQPVYALQAQGLDGKQPPRTSLTEMAAHYIQEIRTVQPNGPYYIGGYSLGGVVAFEIAQQLQAQGEKIALLALFDTDAPGYSKPTSGSDDAEPLTPFGRSLFHLRKLFSLSIKEQLTYVWERFTWHLEIGKLSSFYKFYLRYIRRSLQELRLLEVAGANHQALSNYVPSVYPGQLTLFCSHKKAVGFGDDPRMGWGELAISGVEIYEIPGSHTEMMEEPGVKLLAERLKLCLVSCV